MPAVSAAPTLGGEAAASHSRKRPSPGRPGRLRATGSPWETRTISTGSSSSGSSFSRSCSIVALCGSHRPGAHPQRHRPPRRAARPPGSAPARPGPRGRPRCGAGRRSPRGRPGEVARPEEVGNGGPPADRGRVGPVRPDPGPGALEDFGRGAGVVVDGEDDVQLAALGGCNRSSCSAVSRGSTSTRSPSRRRATEPTSSPHSSWNVVQRHSPGRQLVSDHRCGRGRRRAVRGRWAASRRRRWCSWELAITRWAGTSCCLLSWSRQHRRNRLQVCPTLAKLHSRCQGRISTKADPALELIRDFVNTYDVDDEIDSVAEPAALAAWIERAGLDPGAGPRARRACPGPGAARGPAGDAARQQRRRGRPRRAGAAGGGGRAGEDRGSPSTAARWSCARSRRGLAAFEAELLLAVADAQDRGSWQRIKACPAGDCQWAFYDESRNRSRTWCSMEVCGNRSKTRAYRHRHSGG